MRLKKFEKKFAKIFSSNRTCKNPSVKPILIERIPGTKNHRLVREHIISRIKDLKAGWHIELDTFVDKPPEPYKEVLSKIFQIF